ncbi:MAG: ParB/RepB/Spo0J family partition protein [Acetobacteraceae bacterium]
MSIISIPLSKLIVSPVNVRKTGGTSIDDLAASIEAHGLIQTLTVQSAPKGKYEVVAGGRRLSALQRLMKEKRSANGTAVTKDFPVDCRVLEGEDAVEVSLAENTIRQAMHPADQFEAFDALANQGMSSADIAARFGLSEKVVDQRLKLAVVSPELIAAYRDGKMQLDQLEAFTITDDHDKQEKVWKAVAGTWNNSASSIRRMLTDAKVETSDKRVKAVGLDAYLAAGGTITRDLFSTKDEGYLDDPALLDQLVAEKLEAVAENVRAEGWAWVRTETESFSIYGAGLRTLPPHERGSLSDEQEAQLVQLRADLEAAETAYDECDEDDEAACDELHEKMEAVNDQIDAIENSVADVWTPEAMITAGAVVSLGWQGIEIDRGLVEREESTGSSTGVAGSTTKPKEKPEFSASLLESLSAERTMAMRTAMASDPAVALDTLLWTLATREFGMASSDSQCAKITADRSFPGGQALRDTKAAQEFSDIRDRWTEKLPGDNADLWNWLRIEASAFEKSDLLAFLVATSLNAVQLRGAPAIPNSDDIHAALRLDMAEFWKPTAANYLSRVSKDKVIEALTEAGEGQQALTAFRTMKKAFLTPKAEAALAETRWLPKPLRLPEVANDAGAEERPQTFLEGALGTEKAAKLRDHQRRMMEPEGADEAA